MSELPKSLKAVPLPDKDPVNRFTTIRDLVAEKSYKIIDPYNSSIWGYIAIDNTHTALPQDDSHDNVPDYLRYFKFLKDAPSNSPSHKGQGQNKERVKMKNGYIGKNVVDYV